MKIKDSTFSGLAFNPAEQVAVANWIRSMDRVWNFLSEDVWSEVFSLNGPDEAAIARGLDPFFEAYYNGFMVILRHKSGSGNLEKELQRCRTAGESHLANVLREILRNREDTAKGWRYSLFENDELPSRLKRAWNRTVDLKRAFQNSKTPQTQVGHFFALLSAYERFIEVLRRFAPQKKTIGFQS